jgi:hypothetical protein
MQETSNWGIERRFEVSPYDIDCSVVEGVTKYPDGAEELEKEIWNQAVNRKKTLLEKESPELVLSVHEIKGRKELYETRHGHRMIMVPGAQYRYAGFEEGNRVLQVERTLYSEVEALKSPEYRKMFEREGLPLPHGTIAPVLFAMTTDGKIVATVRGKGTNKYPGAIWGVGGDVDNPDITIGEHLMGKEVAEELNILENSFGVLTQGITWDGVLQKHDLPAIAIFNGDFASIKKSDHYLPDVESVTSIPADRDELAQYIIDNFVDTLDPADENWIGRPSPPCSADLFLIGEQIYREKWAEEVLDALPKSKTTD